jgi:hypothetical protein
MLCANGHGCPEGVAFCPTCGTSVSPAVPARYVTYATATPVRTVNGLAIASMVLGIVWVYWVGSILALIFGLVARKQIKQRGQSGDGMAIAGIVLGIVGIVTMVIVIILIISATHTTQYNY